ncbi:MAG: hypothetical protein JKY46_06670 [Robiginitomaculum sp.]|nr:hypothetical protein [Robiginitomaculum sp.]
MSEAGNKRRYGFFFKEKAVRQARNYADLPFYKKSKNYLTTFFVVISVSGLFFVSIEMVPGEFPTIEVIGAIIDLILAGFVFFNRRWAIILIGVVFSVAQVTIVVVAPETMAFSVVFLLIVTRMCYTSFLVASELKRLKKEEKIADIFS